MALDGSYLHDHASQLDATDASMDEVATVSNGLDRGRVYMEEQATLLTARQQWRECRDPSAEQSIIVHEQSQPPWVPSPRRLELCSYTDNEAEARVPPLARAEEDSLAPFGIGEEVHGHMKRKVRRTVRRFFMDGQTLLSRPPHRHWYAAGRIFRSGHCPESLESSQGSTTN